MYTRFHLALTITHACNMHCTYCYAGRKGDQPMAEQTARRAIERAVASLEPGGVLTLEFCGGEPLLAAPLVYSTTEYARYRAAVAGVTLRPALTTNATVTGSAAWSVMTMDDLDLSVSHDGLPSAHNRHRRMADGCPSSAVVLRTIKRLLKAGVDPCVTMVVRPDALDLCSPGIAFLHSLGVRRFAPVVDLWCCWTPEDASQLVETVAECGRLWLDGFPDVQISWFDDGVSRLVSPPPDSGRPMDTGRVAVSPSGALYPCACLVREDADGNPARLPGQVANGADFCGQEFIAWQQPGACARCGVRSLSGRLPVCVELVRPGDIGQPGSLLCLFCRACAREIARGLRFLSTRVAI